MPRKKGSPRGSSKAGRSRKGGERYACGKLKPQPYNARAVEIRSALLGDAVDGEKLDITTASNPLDLALARGFISEDMHRTARALALVYRRAGIGGPVTRTQNFHEVEAAAALKFESFSTLSGEDFAALWDKVFCEEPAPEDKIAQAEAATQTWARLMGGLDARVRSQLIEVCILDSWPQWLVYRCANKPVPPGWAQRQAQLFEGLYEVRARLQASRPQKPVAAPKPGDRGAPDPETQARRGPMVEERVVYVDEAGLEIPMVGDKTGVAFEVVRRRRR